MPDEAVHAFAYTITIRNTGDIAGAADRPPLGHHRRHGHVEEVRGLAVVGQQPLLKPGERFEYTSWTRLATPQGTMRGTFFCMTEDAQPVRRAGARVRPGAAPARCTDADS